MTELAKRLRRETGASLSKCLIALRAQQGNYEEALNLLRSPSFDNDVILLLLERIAALEAAPSSLSMSREGR